MKRVKLFLLFSVIMLSLGFINLAWGAGHGEASSARAWMDFFWRCVNFALVFAIVYKLFGKKAKEFFSSRTESIKKELTTIEKRKEEAEKNLREVEKKIANLELERKKILEQAEEEGRKIKEMIIAKAKEEAELIKKQAQAKISQELKEELDNIRIELADKIIQSAEKLLLSRLGDKDQQKLIDKYLTKVVLN